MDKILKQCQTVTSEGKPEGEILLNPNAVVRAEVMSNSIYKVYLMDGSAIYLDTGSLVWTIGIKD